MVTPGHTIGVADLSAVQQAIPAIRSRHRRKVIVTANGKGGVGKSSLAAHLAVSIASIGQRVLIIEMDPQGNHAEDLGFISDTAVYDAGKSQADAVLAGTAIQPTGEVRPGLFAVPGGEHLERVIEELYCQQRAGRASDDPTWMFMYAASIFQAADDYDVVILDVAPGSSVLQVQAMVAGDFVLIPSRSDISSRKGLRAVARRFQDALPYNPALRGLGMVLFATGSRATNVQAKIRRQLEDDVQDAMPVFTSTIRHVEAAAVACRGEGLVAAEMSQRNDLDPSLAKSVKALGGDYRSLCLEVLTRIAALNKAGTQ